MTIPTTQTETRTADAPPSENEAPVVIDLGCGNNPRNGAVGVDIRDYPKVDVQTDVRDLPEEWEGSVERAYASHLFEHLDAEGIAETLAEVSRVLEPGGELVFDVPYARAHDADPTHETRWYFKTIAYYLPRDEVERLGWDPATFPDYFSETDIGLELVERDAVAWLDVTAAPLRPFSYALRRVSDVVTTDKWDALPVVGGLAAGNLVFRLKKPDPGE